MQVDWPRFELEAKRVHERYLVEVVEAFGLCPWAREARTKGRVNLRVTFVTVCDPILLLAEVDACMRDSATEIGMLICPLLSHTSAKTFRHLSAAVRAADEARRPRGEQQIAIADFHPIAAVDLTTPERLVPYLRRAPDPMLQIVRTDVLARVRRSQEHGTAYVDPAQLASLALDQLSVQTPALAERVAHANLRAVQSCGVEKLEAVLSDIHADRTRAYARLGVITPTPAHNTHTGDPAQETAFVSASNSDEKPESKAGYCRTGNQPYIDPSLRKCNDI
jgi:hypothetical protein